MFKVEIVQRFMRAPGALTRPPLQVASHLQLRAGSAPDSNGGNVFETPHTVALEVFWSINSIIEI